MIIHSTSIEETKALAAALAPHLQAGDTVVLNGDLGAGKTHFVQGVAKALGIVQPVTSPTFNILLTYECAHPEGDGAKARQTPTALNHFDFYRLEDASELDDIGYWEVLENGGVTFIEWGDKFPEEMPDDYLEIALTVDTQGQRTIKTIPHGPRSEELLTLWQEHFKVINA